MTDPPALGPTATGRYEPARSPTFRSLRESLIAFLVVSHFALGVLACLPPNSKVWGLPVLRYVRNFYLNNRLDQSWSMFSPPPKVRESIQYSVQLPGGWTRLIPLSADSLDRVKGRLVQPRGIFRLLAFSRSSVSDRTPDGLSETSPRAFYYQQLSEYFCRGDGKITGIVGIRFYLVGKGIPHFLETDKYGQPLPPISEFNFQLPLYEQECASE